MPFCIYLMSACWGRPLLIYLMSVDRGTSLLTYLIRISVDGGMPFNLFFFITFKSFCHCFFLFLLREKDFKQISLIILPFLFRFLVITRQFFLSLYWLFPLMDHTFWLSILFRLLRFFLTCFFSFFIKNFF